MSEIVRIKKEDRAKAGAVSVANVAGLAPSAHAPMLEPNAQIETETARKIIAALVIARELQDVTVICGAQGVGKTCAALAYVEQAWEPWRHFSGVALPGNVGAWYVAADPAASGLVPMLKRVCEAVSAAPAERADGAADLHDKIVRRIERSGGVLIIDEAQHLAPAALEQLRAIHDACRIGLVLIGSHELAARLMDGKAVGLDGLRARIGQRLNIAGNTPEDAAKLADAWGVLTVAGRKALTEVATGSGGLRTAVKALRLAAMRSRIQGRDRVDSDLTAACDELRRVA